MSRRVGFARWRSDVASGGNRYDDELTAGLRALGVDVREYAVTGPWPVPRSVDRERFAEILEAEQDWLVDNIVGSAAPEAIAAATAAGRRVTLLVHYFPADEPDLERDNAARLEKSEAAAAAAASRIIVTSAWAGGEIASRYGRHDAVVAVPGVTPAALAPGSSRSGGPPALLWLARLTQTKDPLTFVRALTSLRDLAWTARIVGPDTVDPGLGVLVRDQIEQAGLTDRVAVLGPRDGGELESVWAATDLLVHTSRHETYGMVVTEALSRGIPSIVPSGTGAVEAQGTGATFPSGDSVALAGVLRRWLLDSRLRERWWADAAVDRANLPTWPHTAQIVRSVLVGDS